MASTTVGSITSGSYSTTNMLVNGIGVGTLNFVINSKINQNDVFVITFPSTMSISGLTSVYIYNGGNITSPPSISGQNVTLNNVTAVSGDTISMQFTSIKNPPS